MLKTEFSLKSFIDRAWKFKCQCKWKELCYHTMEKVQQCSKNVKQEKIISCYFIIILWTYMIYASLLETAKAGY